MSTGHPPMVLSYVRFSTAEQIKGDSKRRQLARAQEYAEKRGWKLEPPIDDGGIPAFRGQNIEKGKLSIFLASVQAGRIPSGSVLLIEDLDRFSRSSPLAAAGLIEKIVKAGITVITLIDEMEFTKSNITDIQIVMHSILKFCLAHDESKKKSYRLKKTWAGKRAKAESTPLTSVLPMWLQMKSGKPRLIPEKATVVKKIFSLAIEGMGASAIVTYVNRKKLLVEPICKSTVQKILHNSAVYGSYQPMEVIYEDDRKKRIPAGKAIEKYYEPVIDKPTFLAAQRAIAKRKGKTGGPSSCWVNLFQGIIKTASGSSVVALNKGPGSPERLLVDSRRWRTGGGVVSYPVKAMELAVIAVLSRWKMPVLCDAENSLSRINEVETELAETQKSIKATQDAIVAHGNVVSLIEVLVRQDKKRESLEYERAELLTNNKSTIQDGLSYIQGCRMVSSYTIALEGYDSRILVRTALRRVIERISVDFYKEGVICCVKGTIFTRTKNEIFFSASCHRNHPNGAEVVAPSISSEPMYILHDGSAEKAPNPSKRGSDEEKFRKALQGESDILPSLNSPWGVFTRRKVKEMFTSGLSCPEIARKSGLLLTTVHKMKPQ